MTRCGILLGGITLFSLLGCASQPIQRTATFNEAEYAPYAEPGTATIKGQAFAKTRGGDVKYAAGNTIALNPVTTYSTEFFNVHVIQQLPLSPPDPRAFTYTKTTLADGNGSFEFDNLAEGDYYVTTSITWQVPSQYGPVTTGAMMGTRVHVSAGETAKVVVTR